MNTWRVCLLLFVFVCGCNALVHRLKLQDDTRGSFFIESFGFEVHGQLLLNVSDIRVGFFDLCLCFVLMEI